MLNFSCKIGEDDSGVYLNSWEGSVSPLKFYVKIESHSLSFPFENR